MAEKGVAIRENVDMAFDVYCRLGGDKEATVRELKGKYGLSISRTTLYKWIETYRFDERRVDVDARRQADREALLTARARMVRGLLDRMAMYERYMAEAEKPDHMAQFAYNGIVGQLRLLVRKFEYEEETPQGVEDEDVKAKAGAILRELYGIDV